MPESEKPRHIMIGGFLGAGKTTAIAAFARYLTDRGVRVGLISNDQSTGLVDTALLRSRGFTVEEIAGGCFCCRFDSLMEASEKLARAAAPDVFLAEPVGSCTDLVATVSYPLRRIYGDRFIIAPLSVLVDPSRAARIFGLEPGRAFSEKVVYIYTKQLEEADIIVINKCDSVADELRARLADELRRRFPHAAVHCCAARDGMGLEPWFEQVLSEECGSRPAMELDYDTYGAGEALLGWLNATVQVRAERSVPADGLLLELTRAIQERVLAAGGEIAHLKTTLDAGDIAGRLSVVSAVRGDAAPELREALEESVSSGSLILNLRAEMDPDVLRAIVEDTLASISAANIAALHIEHLESFRPGMPTPVHRDTAGIASGSSSA